MQLHLVCVKSWSLASAFLSIYSNIAERTFDVGLERSLRYHGRLLRALSVAASANQIRTYSIVAVHFSLNYRHQFRK